MAIVLKSETNPSAPAAATPGVSGLAGFNLSDLAAEGRQQLESARQKIREMMEQAHRDAERIRGEAEQRGYRDGEARAEADFKAKVAEAAEQRAQDQLATLRHAVTQMQATYRGWMDDYAASLQTIALAAAERLVGRRLEAEPELLLRWAEEALRSTRAAPQLTLAVSPETLAELGQTIDELLASPDLPEQTHVEADETLSRSDVVVRQSGGEIRAGLEAQLDRLREMLA